MADGVGEHPACAANQNTELQFKAGPAADNQPCFHRRYTFALVNSYYRKASRCVVFRPMWLFTRSTAYGLPTRATEERAKTNILRTRSSQRVPLGSGSCLRRTGHPFTVSSPKGRHRRLSLCSLPVPKQLEGSLRSLISFAQSANSRTWQPARCVIP